MRVAHGKPACGPAGRIGRRPRAGRWRCGRLSPGGRAAAQRFRTEAVRPGYNGRTGPPSVIEHRPMARISQGRALAPAAGLSFPFAPQPARIYGRETARKRRLTEPTRITKQRPPRDARSLRRRVEISKVEDDGPGAGAKS